ncbi:MAG TPA: dienelactone hydrolase family protein [Thermoanaerobaculia bacterium]
MIDMESNTTLVQCYPAHEAVPAGEGPFPPILVLHDRFGLNPHTRNLANRFARAGFYALAPDLYCAPSRFSLDTSEPFQPMGSTNFEYDQEMEARDRAVTLTDERAATVVGQALSFVAGRSAARSGGVSLFGLGVGGRMAFLSACLFPEAVRAAVCLYPDGLAVARPAREGHPTPLDRADALDAPLLLFYGQLDSSIRPDEREAAKQRLTTLGKPFRLEVVPGAGHDFFCEERDTYRIRASKMVWEETLSFLSSHASASP